MSNKGLLAGISAAPAYIYNSASSSKQLLLWDQRRHAVTHTVTTQAQQHGAAMPG